MPRIEPITVIANPWHALDAEGRPAASVQILGTDTVIGGTPNLEKSRAEGLHLYDFDAAPVVLKPETPREAAFYLRAIRDGALIAADPPTAARAGVAYRNPQKALEDAEARAVEAYVDQTGHPPEELLGADSNPPTVPYAAPPSDALATRSPTSETYVDRTTTPSPTSGFQPPPPSDNARSPE